MMAAYTLDELLSLAGIVARDNTTARKALADALDAGQSLVGGLKSPLERSLAQVAGSIGATSIRPEDVRKRRARGRPRGSLASPKKRKQDVVDRAVYFWIQHSPRNLSGAPESDTYEFVKAFHETATGAHENVERQFERAVRPWIDEAKALGIK